MFASTFQSRDGTLGRAHAVRDRFLGQAGACPRGQHFVCEGILGFQGIIGLTEPRAP